MKHLASAFPKVMPQLFLSLPTTIEKKKVKELL